MQTRLKIFTTTLGRKKALREKFIALYEENNRDWASIAPILQTTKGFTPKLVKQLKFTHDLSVWANDDEQIVAIFQQEKTTNSMRDIALQYNKKELLEKLESISTEGGVTDKPTLVRRLQMKLYQQEPTAFVQRMLGDSKETPIGNKLLSGNMATFLSRQPEEFNLLRDSVYVAFQGEEAFKDMEAEVATAVKTELKSLQRIAAITPVPEALPVLMQQKMTSAYHISEMPQEQFVQAFARQFDENAERGQAIARQIHTNAANARIRNEQTVMQWREAGLGTGVDFIDQSIYGTNIGHQGSLLAYIEGREEGPTEHISWELLFSDADLCECGHCTSVYSPAAYFVELLQYLRNNTLDLENINTGQSGFSGTPLAFLFDRRPDLGCLQLTCSNTNTILPYVDLVNEIMENYIVFQTTKAFNVTDETSAELLAQPQHTEYEAYCILHKAVYPFTLPYHQPIDASRIFLKFLKTSRHELLDTFRSPRKGKNDSDSLLPCDQIATPSEDAAQNELLGQHHEEFLQRAVDAEYLGLTQEEYVILTKEAFVTKAYWDTQCDTEHPVAEYQDKIGVKPVHEYYGYETEAEMLSLDESQQLGLTFVKKQFLPRTGVAYTDLVNLLLTQFLNPNMPQGEARAILESIQFSYRYLQSLVNENAETKEVKYKDLIEFLNNPGDALPEFRRRVGREEDPCNPKQEDRCLELKDIKRWVYCYFKQIGKIIVLENNNCHCIDGVIKTTNLVYGGFVSAVVPIELKVKNCIIYDREREGEEPRQIGYIEKNTGKVNITSDEIDATKLEDALFFGEGGESGRITSGRLINARNLIPFCTETDDTCDLDATRLVHLDGSPLTLEEYDCFHRFIRLWRKLGWTIDETDKAIIGLGKVAEDCAEDLFDDSDCDDLLDGGADCGSGEGEELDCLSKELLYPKCEITPDLLHQLVAVKKLLDKTGLEVIKLLSFWTNISTIGDKSLYQRLFLKHNVQALDPVFKADKNGLYLSGKDLKIKEHFPVLMAALKLKADDLHTILNATNSDGILNIESVSLFYRYRLLSRVIGEKMPAFIDVLELFGDVFQDAHTTLDFLDHWLRMEDAGFSFRQLNYIIQDKDFDRRPFAPSQRTILQLAKTLYDGLNLIEANHQDIIEDAAITEDLIRAKVSLLFDTSMVEKVISLLLGTTIYTTNAPTNLNIEIPATATSLAQKLKYSKTAGTIQVTGILTEIELLAAKALDNDLAWSAAFDRIAKQNQKLFKEVLADIFKLQKSIPDQTAIVQAAEDTILAGDIHLALEDIPENQPDPNTVPLKQKAFLTVFMPYLRQKLRERFILETLAGSTGLEKAVVEVLIFDILKTGNPATSLYSIFESIKFNAPSAAMEWKGFLLTTTKETYTFVVNNTNNTPNISINGESLNFTQQDDPTNEWWSDGIELQAGQVYHLQITGINSDLKDLRWKTSISSFSELPSSALLPDYATTETAQAFTLLKKVALTVAGFDLKEEELRHFHRHPSDFTGIDFNNLSLNQWFRIEAYVRLRNSIAVDASLLPEFFQWTKKTYDSLLLSQKISELTLWEQEKVEKLLVEAHFDLNAPAHFSNEVNLIKLQKALAVADKIGMDIDLLFKWAKPTSHFNKTHKIAQDLQKVVRAQYLQEDWEQVVRPLNDQLRNNQKNALISYLLVHPKLVEWGVTDADGLFEYFLIDVQMDACMETSRIKQGISSLQLFVQRCFLGLEAPDILNDKLDRGRWDWMQRYRVWEANRKVFLYPENWIESNLRDDKSVFYKELESELLQDDVNTQKVLDALKSYLYKVDEVANMEIIGVHIEARRKLHVFARTRNAPYFFHYRHLNIEEENWYPWEKMQVDIPSYDVEKKDGEITGNGCYLTPFVWNGRLLVFFPQFMKKTKVGSGISTSYWEIKMGWSELRNGKWTQKQLSKKVIIDAPDIQLSEGFANAQAKLDEAKVEYDKHFNSLITITDYPEGDLEKEQQHFNENKEDQAAINAFHHAVDETQQRAALLSEAQSKLIAAENAMSGIQPAPIPDISKYIFEPVWSSDDKLQIKVLYGNNAIPDIDGNMQVSLKGRFEFDGTHIQAFPHSSTAISNQNSSFFHHDKDSKIESLQSGGLSAQYVFDDDENGVTEYNNTKFHHPYSHKLMGLLNSPELSNFFAAQINIPDRADAFGAYFNEDQQKSQYNELKKPYSLYNWELFFHSPMALANELRSAQQFEKAMQWYHYVFNPTAAGKDAKRFWQFFPFRELDGEDILASIFNSLQANTDNQNISEWRDKPFRPHLIARSRPVAYMKWTVMRYLDNLIEWGDYLFRQDTIESLNYATQLYVMASHILGKRPHFIPKRGRVQPQTYLSLLDKWDAFSNAVVELEIVAPYSNQINEPLGTVNGEPALANIFSFGTTLYFCIPNNPKLLSYWDTIDDRLFKIRHCMNMAGVVRKLPLFEPPIDPALLVRANAQGLNIASVLNDLNTPLPNYRFYYLLQKALELCNEVKSLGNAMLSALEKKDAEAIARLRAHHESNIHGMIMDVREQQLKEANLAMESLLNSRKAPEHRMRYYLQLVGEDTNQVPDFNSDFSALPNLIKPPVEESELRLNEYEKEDLDKSHAARGWQIASQSAGVIASILHALPDYIFPTDPYGRAKIGGSHLGNAANALGGILQLISSQYTFESSNAAKKGGHRRAMQERNLQVNLAGFELKQIDKQILTQEIRIAIAGQEIKNQQQQIDNAQEIKDFLENKYSNEELYSWMKGELKTLYYQVYSLAYELAKKAEKVFHFERGSSNSNYIQSGYWNTGREGLLAGENLYVGLKKLEAAWHERKGHDYEITKSISLRQVHPMALLQLRETGKCEFALAEVLFDMDFPGHYQRRIKSVSLSIPCVVGPYTGINAHLRLLEHKYRTSNIAKDQNDYPENLEEADDRFLTHHIPISAIAVSSAQNDSGLFELNFRDDRYLPFEGAGAISKWRIELPTEIRQFDYHTISDVILQIRYTAKDGGERLKLAASRATQAYFKAVEEWGQEEGTFAIIDLKHDLPTEWHKAVNIEPADGESRKISLDKVAKYTPYFAKFKNGQLRDKKDLLVTDVQLVMETDLKAEEISLQRGVQENAFLPGIDLGRFQSFVIRDLEWSLGDWHLLITKNDAVIKQGFLIIRLLLK